MSERHNKDENQLKNGGAQPDSEQPLPAEQSSQPPALGAALRSFARSAQKATREVARAVQPHVTQAARRASEEARHAAEVARPHAEEFARQARAAAEAARPRAEQAARDTARYAREHEEDLRRAGANGARAAARVVTPRPLRPAIDAFEEELRSKLTREEPPQTESKTEPDTDTKPDNDQTERG